jgi:hypothetical protein
MKMFTVGLIGLLLLPGVVAAEEPTRLDFAQGVVLECKDDVSICKYVLPEQVYSKLIRDDFGDVRVFNKDGDSVPFALQHREMKIRVDDNWPENTPIPFFPVYGDQHDEDPAPYGTIVSVTRQGTLIQTKRQISAGKQNRDKNPVLYLLDTSQLKRKPDRLEFKWGEENTDSIVEIRIEESDDLNDWLPVVKSAVLTDIRFEGNRLQQNEIPIPEYYSRYLKVSFLKHSDRVKFSSIRAVYGSRETYVDEPRQWSVIQSEPSVAGRSDILYGVKGVFPIDRIRLTVPQINTVFHVVVSSRKNDAYDWRVQYEGMMYSLNIRGVYVERMTVPVDSSADRQFKIVIDPNPLTQKDFNIQFEVGWLPHYVLFVAQGHPPYTLAYGSGHVDAWENQMDALLENLDSQKEKYLVAKAVKKKDIVLGGDNQLIKPREPVSWSKIILWIVLVTSVALCGGMAWKLMLQINREKRPLE